MSMNDLTIVTVTYGRRWHFLKQVLSAAARDKVARVIVVDNGAGEDICDLVKADQGSPLVDVLTMERNHGSAAGYARGLALAIERASPYVLLLDDDNVPLSGTLENLLGLLKAMEAREPDRLVAVAGFRKDHTMPLVLTQLSAASSSIPQNACAGFRLRKTLDKFRGCRPLRARGDLTLPQDVVLPFVPYGGLLIGRQALQKIGFPDPKYLLYQDDTDFTYRITKNGGAIHVRTDAPIIDLETSWSVKRSERNSFYYWVMRDNDRMVYYSFRNVIYWERKILRYGGIEYWLNVFGLLTILASVSLLKGRLRRFALLLSAIRDAYTENMGEAPAFPLDQTSVVAHR